MMVVAGMADDDMGDSPLLGVHHGSGMGQGREQSIDINDYYLVIVSIGLDERWLSTSRMTCH